jgi:hypothetical protein
MAFMSILAGLCYGWLTNKLPWQSLPPGSVDIFMSNEWDRESISHFLDIPIPQDATGLEIEGIMGRVGSLGMLPQLAFSFHAPPESAWKFATAFCDGVLYSGYNPFESVETSWPTSESIFFHGIWDIHYSHSRNFPDTILGNRCVRIDRRQKSKYGPVDWLEEIVIDMSNPTDYVVSYRLPDAPQGTTDAYYLIADAIMPFDDFYFLVSGVRRNTAPTADTDYRIAWDTMCLETAWTGRWHWDYVFSNWHERMEGYHNSDVEILVDEIALPPVRMDGRKLVPLTKPSTTRYWNYCLDTTEWGVGSHTMRIIVSPPEGEELELEWTFEIQEQQWSVP